MCAINGYINWQQITAEEVTKVTTSLEHMKYRGPDVSNINQTENTVLGHNRLSILDLQARSNQPMQTDDKRYTLVFNGEIYNYKSLKEDLQKRDIVFNSTSDTEVLLKGYVFYGKAFVSQLRGMFAFVIWDNQEKTAFMARDRFGEKPFYFFNQATEVFAFASNLSGIVALYNQSLVISKQAIYELFAQQYIENDSCIYEGIQKLAPGTYAEISADTFEITEYWQPNYQHKINDTFSESVTKTHALLEESVAEQLEADVPVGLFLSGGVDSSIIAALASEHKNDITAITMSVPNSKADESEAARFVAKTIGINHKIVNLDYNCVSQLPAILQTMEPLADASLIPSMAIAQEAHKDFKVMLSGDGGDEVFGGYKKPVVFNQHKSAISLVTKTLVHKIIQSGNLKPYRYFYHKLNEKRLFQLGGLSSYYESISLPTAFSKDILLSKETFINKSLQHLQNAQNFTKAEADKMLYVDVKSKLPNDFLFKMDSANMFYSVESRAPFLDYRILEYTSQLSVNQLMPNAIDKEILKNIGATYLPKDFFNLPKKGFSIPYYEYLETSWGDLLTHFINEGISSDLHLIDAQTVLDLVASYRAQPNFRAGKILYSILVFEIWLRVFHLKMNPETIQLATT